MQRHVPELNNSRIRSSLYGSDNIAHSTGNLYFLILLHI